ncbi:MAG: hypothetical protein GEV13_29365 [Rhodospirillales bacterium]|nr:hypothetical protein [Rhodospirillales bacterium]
MKKSDSGERTMPGVMEEGNARDKAFSARCDGLRAGVTETESKLGAMAPHSSGPASPADAYHSIQLAKSDGR